MTKFFKNRKRVAQKAVEPRSIEEVTKEYTELCGKAGQAQYQVMVFTKELERLNERLLSVNQEAAARNELDRQEKATAEVEEVKA